MDLQPLRQAMRSLSPLLRRRGTSPGVGKALRRAIEQLDKALVATDAQAQIQALGAAVAELRGCVGLIAQSDVPADREQLDGANAALSALTPLVAGGGAPPPPPSPPPAPGPVPPTAPLRLPPQPPSISDRSLAGT